jgi:hypothetical protein
VSRSLRRTLAGQQDSNEREFRRLELGPKGVEQLALVYFGGGSDEPAWIVHAKKPIPRKAFVPLLMPKGVEKEHRGVRYHEEARADAPGTADALFFPGDRLAVFGPAKRVLQVIDHRRCDALVPLAREVQAIGPKHLIVSCFDLGFFKENRAAVAEQAQAVLSLLDARSGRVTVITGPETSVSVQLRFADRSAAREGEKTARAGLKQATFFAAGLRGRFEEAAYLPRLVRGAAALKALEEGLKEARIERDGEVLRFNLQADVFAGRVLEVFGFAMFAESDDEDKKLSLTAPPETSIKQGETVKVNVRIEREGFDKDVVIELSDLPDGVTAAKKRLTIPRGKVEGTFTLAAKRGAPASAGHKVQVRASSDGLISAPVKFVVNVGQK